MSRKKTFIKGTFILTTAGLVSRILGFGYRIFLSQIFTAEEIGVYQLIFPIYALGLALSVSGIEHAIARSVSAKIAKSQTKEAKQFMLSSLVFSFIISLFCAYVVQKHAVFISCSLLQETSTYELLIILSYAFPFASIHSCIIGYYFGKKQSSIPATAQIIEQVTRVLSVILLYTWLSSQAFTIDISISVIGLVFGEIASTVFTVYYVTRKSNLNISYKDVSVSFMRDLKELLPLSTPLTANRVTINLLNSIEALSIPIMLQTYGLTSSESLTIYGILFGMCLPCILFPTAITSSVSAMLLPTIAEIQALNNKKEIKLVVHKTIQYCTLLGLICLISFFFFSNVIGILLFKNILVGDFLKVLAWLCPFLYLNTTLLSIINGLGQPMITFFLNIISLMIRIAGIFIFIPQIGIWGYLSALLASQIFVTIGCILTFQKFDII